MSNQSKICELRYVNRFVHYKPHRSKSSWDWPMVLVDEWYWVEDGAIHPENSDVKMPKYTIESQFRGPYINAYMFDRFIHNYFTNLVQTNKIAEFKITEKFRGPTIKL